MRREIPEFFVCDDDPDFVEVHRQSYRDQVRFICERWAPPSASSP